MVSRGRSRSAAIVLAIALGVSGASPASAEETPGTIKFADWTSMNNDLASGSLLGNPVSMTGTSLAAAGSTLDGSATWFADGSNHTPPLATSDAIAFYGYDPPHSYSLASNNGIRDPILHIASLASVLEFPTGTSITRLSGEPTFTVSGNKVTGEIDGTLDSFGTVRLNGTFSSIDFTATKNYPDDSQDGIYVQMGAPVPPAPETTIVAYQPEPQPEGYHLDRAFVAVSGRAGYEGRNVETRCVLNPATVPATFDDLPPSCFFQLDIQPIEVLGTHTMYAASRDPAGVTEPVKSLTFRVSHEPDTTTVGGPFGLYWRTEATFDLRSTVPGSTFECRLEPAPFEPCTSPYTVRGLRNGDQYIEVRAIAPGGAVDRFPDRRHLDVMEEATLRPLTCTVVPLYSAPLYDYSCHIGRGPNVCPENGFRGDCLRQGGCDQSGPCTWTSAICPVGTQCTLTTTGRLQEPDEGRSWGLQVEVAVADIWDLDVWKAPAYGTRARLDSCDTPREPGSCEKSVTLTALGDDRPIFGACGHYGGGGIWPDERLGPGNQRRIDCRLEVHIKRVGPLAAAATPGLLQVFAPGAGILAVQPSIARVRRQATAAVARVAPFSTTVAGPGPVAVNLRLNRDAKRRLRRRKRLPLTLQLTFTPQDGAAVSRTTRVVLRPRARKPRECPRRHRGTRRAKCRPSNHG